MGEARRRQPDKALRIAEAKERVRLDNEYQQELQTARKKLDAKRKYEQRQAIIDDDALDDKTKDSLLKALDKEKINYSLLSLLVSSSMLVNNPVMEPYIGLYNRISNRKGKNITSMGKSVGSVDHVFDHN